MSNNFIAYPDNSSGATGLGSSTVQQHCVKCVRRKER